MKRLAATATTIHMKIPQKISIMLPFIIILLGCRGDLSKNETSMQAKKNGGTITYSPTSGSMGGDVVQMRPQTSLFRFPIHQSSEEEVHIDLYQVDQESFFKNSHGGFAAFEGGLDLNVFGRADPVFQGTTKIVATDEANAYLNGYVGLPIKDPGHYYLEFKEPGASNESPYYHILLEVADIPTPFNYQN